MKLFLLDLYRKIKKKQPKRSFAQTGEYLIIKFIFDNIGIKKPSYLDIGAHHPLYLSNTAIFYKNGCRGINIEPDPNLFKLFKKYRKRDINLNIAVSDTEGHGNLFIMSEPALNTMSETEASRLVKEHGLTIKKQKQVEIKTIDLILKTHHLPFPDLLSLDVEGLDERIIKSIDYKTNFPKVICVETLSFDKIGHGVKNDKLISMIQNFGYYLFADTYINSIFIRKELWFNRELINDSK